MSHVMVEVVRIDRGEEVELGPDDSILAVSTGQDGNPGVVEYGEHGQPVYKYELIILRVREQEEEAPASDR